MSPETARAHIAALEGLELRIRNTALNTTDVAVLLRFSSEQVAIREAIKTIAAAFGPPLRIVR